MRSPHIDLGAQDLNGFNGQNILQKIAGSKVLDKDYNSYQIGKSNSHVTTYY
jgi:hypothetical protein